MKHFKIEKSGFDCPNELMVKCPWCEDEHYELDLLDKLSNKEEWQTEAVLKDVECVKCGKLFNIEMKVETKKGEGNEGNG